MGLQVELESKLYWPAGRARIFLAPDFINHMKAVINESVFLGLENCVMEADMYGYK
jgi:hypothetical protein